jgi:ribosomal-protein-alanine N-acetyltransferase
MEFNDLYGDRIDLLKIGQHGLEDMHEYSTKPEFYSFLEYDPFITIEHTSNYLSRLIERSDSDNGHYWFIHLKSKKIIGTFGLIDIDGRKGLTEIGYGISPDFWGKGYFNEALTMVLKYLFNKLNFHKVWAKTQANNIPSIKGLENAGFKKEAVFRDYYLSIRGDRYDAIFLSILKNEFSLILGNN